jgi:hypothetical protein
MIGERISHLSQVLRNGIIGMWEIDPVRPNSHIPIRGLIRIWLFPVRVVLEFLS